MPRNHSVPHHLRKTQAKIMATPHAPEHFSGASHHPEKTDTIRKTQKLTKKTVNNNNNSLFHILSH